jgi:hypothetical protein
MCGLVWASSSSSSGAGFFARARRRRRRKKDIIFYFIFFLLVVFFCLYILTFGDCRSKLLFINNLFNIVKDSLLELETYYWNLYGFILQLSIFVEQEYI